MVQPADEPPDTERTSGSLARELLYGLWGGRKTTALLCY